MPRLRTTRQIEAETGCPRNLLNLVYRFGLVTGPRRIGKAIVWDDDSANKALEIIRRMKADPEARAAAVQPV